MDDLTIIIPAKQEKDSLPEVIKNLKGLNCKIVVSLQENDIETINAIKDLEIEIFYQSGKGYGNSLREAITNCKTKFFCIFNADGSFDNKDLSKMYGLVNNLDFVFASRYFSSGGSDDDTIVTFIGNKFFSKIGNILFSLKISDILFTYVMGNTESFRKLKISSNDFKFCVELPIKIEVAKMKYDTIPSYEKKRISGKKKVNEIIDGSLILFEIIKLFFIYKIFKKKIIS